MSRTVATIVGLTSILQWGAQVLLSTYVTPFPPLQTIAMTFFIAFLVMVTKWIVLRQYAFAYARFGLKVWLIGITGLFGYYLLFYVALKQAPAVEVTLLVNLWPLLMVLFSGLLPGEKLHWYHFVGCVAGVAGSALLFKPETMTFVGSSHLIGLALSVAAAVVWAAFCVSSRAIGSVPTDTVGWYCLMTAVLASVCHALLEKTVVTVDASAWWGVIALGIGPIGLAFFAWDVGLKRGNIQLLGVAAFFIPIISAVLLVMTGHGTFDVRVDCAALLITGGALIASNKEVISCARYLKSLQKRWSTA